ncbi:MAG: hypothetical protein IE885_01875 [Campylobacterales bacterium]|nr:hypothetical protein [Campylobacterales bacterium]
MNDDIKKVIIRGIDIPFIDLVVLLVKLALASIPALIIIYFVFAFFGTVFGGIFHMFMFRGM